MDTNLAFTITLIDEATEQLAKLQAQLDALPKDKVVNVTTATEGGAAGAVGSTATAGAEDVAAAEGSIASSSAKMEGDVMNAEHGIGSKLGSLGGMFKSQLGAAIPIAAGVAGYSFIKMGIDFQDAVTRLVTGAGESKKNIGMITQGLEQMAGQVGSTPTDLANGMYMIESAGYHGATALNVLRAAEEGAKESGSDLGTTSNALTSLMKSYGGALKSPTVAMNEMLTAVGQGKMHMQDFASALSAVAPLAAEAGISFSQVGGAVATMTATGTSAQQATQDLANMIRNLLKPTSGAVNEMNQLGLNAQTLEANVGKNGLTGTLHILAQAISKKMTGGLLDPGTLMQSINAVQDLNKMISAMPPSIQTLAQKFMSGSETMMQFRRSIPTNDMGMIQQFQSLYQRVHGFSDQIKGGLPALQTYAGAMATMLGGATGLNTSLALTGQHFSTFTSNVNAISDASKHAGKNVIGWGTLEKDFGQQMSQIWGSITGMIDSVVIPILDKLGKWFAKNLPIILQDARGAFNTVKTVISVAMTVASPALHALGAGVKFLFGHLKQLEPILGIVLGLFIAYKAIEKVTAIMKDAQLAFSVVKGAMLGLATAEELSAGATEAGTAGYITQSIALKAVSAATKIAAAAQAVWNAIMDANPIMLIVIGVAAVVAGIILLATHVKAVGQFFSTVFGAIKTVVGDVIGFFVKHWQILYAILPILLGPIGLVIDAVLAIATHFTQVKNAVGKIIGDIAGFFVNLWHNITTTVGDIINGVVQFFETLPGKIWKCTQRNSWHDWKSLWQHTRPRGTTQGRWWCPGRNRRSHRALLRSGWSDPRACCRIRPTLWRDLHVW